MYDNQEELSRRVNKALWSEETIDENDDYDFDEPDWEDNGNSDWGDRDDD